MIAHRTVNILRACVVGVGLVEVAWLLTGFGGEIATRWFSDLIPIPLAAAATTASWITARREHGRARRAWVLLGLAALSWGAGEAVWSWYELIEGREVPFPSAADVGFLGLIPLATLALLSFPSAPAATRTKIRSILDGTVIAGSILFVSWATVLGPTVMHSEGRGLQRALAIAYPFGDVVLIVVMILVAQRAHGSRSAFAYVTGGLAAIAVADSAFLYLTEHGAYASGAITDTGWTVGFGLIALGAVADAGRARGATPERMRGGETLLPYVPFGLAMLTAAWWQVAEGALTPPLFWLAIGTVGTMATRTVLIHLDNMGLNRDLEARVAARTQELSDAVRRVQDARRLQDAFVASVSHELRTPLTAIVLSTEMLMRPGLGLSESALRIAAGGQRGAKRMARLVEDLLLTSSIADGVEVRARGFGVEEALRDAVADAACAARVTIVCEPHVTAYADADRVAVIVGHLLSNADKFAPTGRVTIEALAVDGTVEISVSDEGPGVPPSQAEAIFERFYQVDQSDTRRHEGAGLGLFIARRLAEAMEGQLRVDDPARGARFRLLLPAAQAAAQGAPAFAARDLRSA